MTWRGVWAIVLALAILAALAVSGVVYVQRVDQAADRRDQARAREICVVIVLIDDRYQQLPPTADPEATKFAAAIHAYRLKLGC